MLRLVLALLVALAAQPDQETLVVAGTRALVDALFSGRTTALVGRFGDEMTSALPETQLKEPAATVVQQAGAYRGVTDSRVSMRDGIRLVVLTCDFANGPVDVSLAWGDIADWVLAR